jgi:sarcosine oxidase subunit beta
MAQSADVVVIGGGVMGVSIAHHLCAAGAGSVALVEKRHIGAGSSGKSGAIIRQHYSTPLLVRMARHGVQTFRAFEEHAGRGSGWENTGCLIVGPEGERAAVEGNVRLMREAGAEASVRSGLELTVAAPIATFEEDEIGAWEPEAGCVDPAKVLHAYARSAATQGARLFTGTEVLEVEIGRGAVTAVMTSEGRFETGTVVLCAGPWARRLAARAGVELPLHVIRPQIGFHRRPEDEGQESHPVVGDLRNGFYCRPMPGGVTLVGALDVSADERVLNPDDYDETVSPEFFSWTREAVSKRMPSMRRSFGRGGYAGLYTMTPDSHPILGEAPGVRGLYLAVGFSGHGFKLSPAVGRGIAELVTLGRYESLDLSPLRPTRFLEGAPIQSAYAYGLLS